MVNLMLDNLRRKAAEALLALFKLHVLIGHGNFFVAHCSTLALQRQAALLRHILAGALGNLRVQHRNIRRADIYGDNAFLHADHICCQAHAAVRMSCERIYKSCATAMSIKVAGCDFVPKRLRLLLLVFPWCTSVGFLLNAKLVIKKTFT